MNNKISVITLCISSLGDGIGPVCVCVYVFVCYAAGPSILEHFHFELNATLLLVKV